MHTHLDLCLCNCLINNNNNNNLTGFIQALYNDPYPFPFNSVSEDFRVLHVILHLLTCNKINSYKTWKDSAYGIF